MWRAQRDAPVVVVTAAGMFFFFDHEQYLSGLVVFPGRAFDTPASLQLVEVFLAQMVIACPILGALCIIMAPIGSGHPDRDPKPERTCPRRAHLSRWRSSPVPRVEHN